MSNPASSSTRAPRIVAALAIAATAVFAPSIALADSPAPESQTAVEAVNDVQSALAEVRADGELTGRVVADASDALPETASEPIDLGEVSIGLPAEGASRQVGNNVVFDGASDTTVVAQMTAGGGARALVSLDSPASPDRYRFPIAGATRLDLQSDGSVIAYAGDESIGSFDAPWARDANGVSVPTHYEIDGTTLVQVVNHANGGFAYPIIADPWWNPFSWNWRGAARAVGNALVRCGRGAGYLTTPTMAGAWVTAAVIAYNGGRAVSLAIPGGQAVFLGTAVAGCVGNVLFNR
jgi:hypothetical protein